MFRFVSVSLLLFGLCTVGTGCSKAIGDDCGTNADCPTGSYCDKTMPGGMCTIANCRPDDCPDDSVCIEFPNQERYCMARCGSDGDCRSDYQCITELGDDAFCSVRNQ